MTLLRRLLLLSFIESYATILWERGVYFYTTHQLGYSGPQNLWLALWFGLFYIGGALSSHRLSHRWSERTLLLATLVGQMVAYLAAFLTPRDSGLLPVVLTAVALLLGLANGLKWPVIESYVSAGRTPRESSRAIGQFNIAWATAVPLAVLSAGQILETWPWIMFVAPALCNLASLWLVQPLARAPVHLEQNHPERLTAAQVQRYQVLLSSVSWAMFGSFTLLFLLAPLVPIRFHALGLAERPSTALWAVVDVARVVMFFLLQRTHRWHGGWRLLLGSALALPAAFFMVLFGPNVPTVLVGEIIFGAASGYVYYAHLYYAITVKNAAVEAGGEHEALIGAGFAIGPAIGLLGIALAAPLGGQVAGVIAGVAPLIALCTIAGLRPLARLRSRRVRL